MHNEAPAVAQDQPAVLAGPDLNEVLAEAGVPRSIPTELLQFARRADLRLEAQPGDGPATTEPPEGEPTEPAGGGESEEPSISLDDFDPSSIPDDITAEQARERIKAFQADYTTKTQEIGEVRRSAEQHQAIVDGLRNPATAPEFIRILGIDGPAILDALGYQLEGQEEVDEDLLDPEEQVAQLNARLDQESAQRRQVEREESEADFIEDEVTALEKAEGREFDDDEVSIITTYSRVHPDQLGNPDVQSAYKHLSGILTRRQQEWVESKKGPRPAKAGAPSRTTADLSTEEGRMKAAEEASAAARASQEQ